MPKIGVELLPDNTASHSRHYLWSVLWQPQIHKQKSRDIYVILELNSTVGQRNRVQTHVL
jgi:hypothetical protein